jgi:outer membrane protein TolC
MVLAAAGSAQSGGDTPPAWRADAYDGGEAGIGLLEAVRETLERDPNLLLQEQDTKSQEGRVLEAAGDFDWFLSGQLSWEHRLQALRQSVIEGQQDVRNQVADAQVESCQEEDRLTLKLQELTAAQTTMGIDISTDIGFDAQITLLEAAILSADNAILQRELENTRNNLLTTEISLTQDDLAAANQVCQESGATLVRLGEVPKDEDFDIGRANIRLEKLNRSGILFAPYLNAAYDSTQYVGKHNGFITPALDPFGQPLISPSGIPLDRLISFGGKDIDDIYTFDLGFEVVLPLGQGRGRVATAGFEKAASIDLDASELILEHGASESVLNTLFAYWNLVAAAEQVVVLEDSVGLQGGLRGTTEALIEANELPGAELARSRASEANSLAQLEGAYRDLATARLDLVEAMGYTVDDLGTLPVAIEPFPEGPSPEEIAALGEDLIQSAMERRLDLAASRSLTESGLVLAEAATTALRPRIDLTLGAWYIARGEKTASDAIDATASNPSWRVAFALDRPLGNRTARGRLAQSEALVHQRQISEEDLARRIRIAVGRALASLEDAMDQQAKAEESVAAYQRVVEVEVEKLKLGETTLIDSILTEQQQTSARLALISARFQVATLIAQLRFETGTLIEQVNGASGVNLENLTTLPEGGRL